MIGIEVKTKKNHDVKKGLEAGYLQGLTAFLTILQSDAKLLSPVDTGILRASIFRKIVKGDGVIGSNVSYAIYQEGTEENPGLANNGRGFLRASLDRNRARIGAIFGKFIRTGIRSN